MARIYQYNALSTELEPVNHLSSNLTPTIENLMSLKHEHARIQVNGADISELLWPRVERLHADEARHQEKLKYSDFAQLARATEPTLSTKHMRYDKDLKAKALEMVRKGTTLSVICKSLDIPHTTLYNWTWKSGLSVKAPTKPTPKPAPIPDQVQTPPTKIQRVRTDYSAEFKAEVAQYQKDHPHLSFNQLSTQFDVPMGTLTRWLRRGVTHHIRRVATPQPLDPTPMQSIQRCNNCVLLEAELKSLREDAALFKKLLIKELK